MNDRREISLRVELPPGTVSSVVHGDAAEAYVDVAAWPAKPIRTNGHFTREVTWTTPQWWFDLTWAPILGAAPDPRRHFTIGGNPLPGALRACVRRLTRGKP